METFRWLTFHSLVKSVILLTTLKWVYLIWNALKLSLVFVSSLLERMSNGNLHQTVKSHRKQFQVDEQKPVKLFTLDALNIKARSSQVKSIQANGFCTSLMPAKNWNFPTTSSSFMLRNKKAPINIIIIDGHVKICVEILIYCQHWIMLSLQFHRIELLRSAYQIDCCVIWLPIRKLKVVLWRATVGHQRSQECIRCYVSIEKLFRVNMWKFIESFRERWHSGAICFVEL